MDSSASDDDDGDRYDLLGGGPKPEDGEPLVDEATGEVLPEAKAGSLWLAKYLLMQRSHLKSLPAADVLLGRITWAEVE